MRMGIRPNFQKLRQGRAASVVRRLVHRTLVGGDAWPPTFRPPSDRALRPLPSPNVYVHLPFCETFCPHCPYNKAKADLPVIAAYRGALGREIGDYMARPDALPVSSLYFGGGTPSLTPDLVTDAISKFRPLLAEDAEIAIEVHPAHATRDLLARLRSDGVNRISLGLESLEPAHLKRLGRRYSPDAALRAVEDARAEGFEMVDVNLILGIPGQTVEAFLDGVAKSLAAGADQISAYPLFTFGHTPAGQTRHADTYARADDLVRLRMQRGVSEMTRRAGFRRTSVWSYTRDGVSPYTTVTRPDYVGFGAGAGSKAGGLVLFNTFSVPAYVEATPRVTALSYRLSERERKADWLYWQVYNARIERAAYEERFGIPLEGDFGRVLRLLRLAGLLKREGCDEVLTESGAIWVHRVQSLFSLAGIDAMWTACQKDPWPGDVVLA
jgi:oxygen-independent coproporphyrinogen-3 oxidase